MVCDSLCLGYETLVQLYDMVANEPDQVREVWSSRLVVNKLKHVLVIHWGRGQSADTHTHSFVIDIATIILYCVPNREGFEATDTT